jgi:acyl carrier protein
MEASFAKNDRDPSTVEREVRRFLDETFPLARSGFSVESDASLVDAGIIDSTGVLELVEFLEESYGIHVGDDELTPENLDSIDRIAAFVERKLRSAHEA